MKVKTRVFIFITLAGVLTACLVCFCVNRSIVRLCQEKPCAVTGTLIYDSSFSKSGNLVLNIKLKSSENAYGNKTQAFGLITAVSKEKTILSCGVEVRLEGQFEKNLFICDSITVIHKTLLQKLRERIILKTEERLGNTKASDLSAMLILGRSDDYTNNIRQKASDCGCLHILALSGMHLSVISTFIKKIFGNKTAGKTIALLAVSFFLFIAGPRPSLVRAYIMFILGFLPPGEKLCTAFVIHVLIFPMHTVNIGFIFGYISLVSIVFVSETVRKLLYNVMPYKLSDLLGLTICILFLNAPLQLYFNGCWEPATIIAGPPASLLITISMGLGFAVLAFPSVNVLAQANSFVFTTLCTLFDKCSEIPNGNLSSYFIMLAVMSVLLVFLKTLKL